ncbi:MAG: SOS response-associated peptidase [Chitinophagia bacterium]|nr:SOS response-associated peptidase [Chitinophagia bacterium]
MCYYNGIRVSKEEFIRLKNLEVQVKDYDLNCGVMSGFEYANWPILIPAADGKSISLTFAHWELIPSWIINREALAASRKKFTTLNATAEKLLESRVFKSAALQRRCLVLSSGFFEWRHWAPAGSKKAFTYPYHITVSHRPYFFMAGIWQDWTDRETGETFPTFAIVTTAANVLMEQVHNTKKRMPVILPEEEAFQWIQPNLSEAQISQLAHFSIDSHLLSATPIRKDFRTAPDPTEPYQYADLPSLSTF